jgi:hypothetical protein
VKAVRERERYRMASFGARCPWRTCTRVQEISSRGSASSPPFAVGYGLAGPVARVLQNPTVDRAEDQDGFAPGWQVYNGVFPAAGIVRVTAHTTIERDGLNRVAPIYSIRSCHSRSNRCWAVTGRPEVPILSPMPSVAAS